MPGNDHGVEPLSIEQLEEMIAFLTSSLSADDRAESNAFKHRFSKRARIEELEQEVELLQRMVCLLVLEKLTAMREEIRKGEASKETLEFLMTWTRLTTVKKGES
jgi:hypothetical protein